MRFFGKVILGSLWVQSDVGSAAVITEEDDLGTFRNTAKKLKEIRAEVAKVNEKIRRKSPNGKETVWVYGATLEQGLEQEFQLTDSFVRAFDLTLFRAKMILKADDGSERVVVDNDPTPAQPTMMSRFRDGGRAVGRLMENPFRAVSEQAENTWKWLWGTNSASRVPAAHGEESFVIKYVDNCESKKLCPSVETCDLSKIDPLVNEFVFAKLISSLTEWFVTADMWGISPKFSPMYYELGGPKDPPTGVSTTFIINNGEATCSGATARFIVEQRVGESVNSIMNRFFDGKDKSFDATQKIILATKIFSDGIYLLDEIHKLGIIHGDIHPGNLALLDYRMDPLIQLGLWIKKTKMGGKMAGKTTLTLIDFGKAQFIPNITSESSKFDEGMNLMLLSPWHLQGSEILGPKDDVFRMFEIYLNLLSHQGLVDYYASIPSLEGGYANRLAHVKLSDELLSHLTLPPEAGGIKEELKKLHTCVSQVVQNHTEIRTLTSTILSKLTTTIDDPVD
jgi:hypothetical protein